MHHNAINKGMLLHKNIESKYELTKQQKPFGKCAWCDYVDYSWLLLQLLQRNESSIGLIQCSFMANYIRQRFFVIPFKAEFHVSLTFWTDEQ